MHDECGGDGSENQDRASSTSDGSESGTTERLAPIIDMDAHRVKKAGEKEARDLRKLFGWAIALAILAIVVWAFATSKKGTVA